MKGLCSFSRSMFSSLTLVTLQTSRANSEKKKKNPSSCPGRKGLFEALGWCSLAWGSKMDEAEAQPPESDANVFQCTFSGGRGTTSSCHRLKKEDRTQKTATGAAQTWVSRKGEENLSPLGSSEELWCGNYRNCLPSQSFSSHS